MRNNIDQVENRRVLKKIRRNFINKIPEGQLTPQAEPIISSSLPPCLKLHPFNIIDPLTGIAEKNRKIYFGIHYVQSSFTIQNVSIANTQTAKVMTINLKDNEHNSFNSWEYGTKRLESYGDLDLAILGRKIRERNIAYPGLMEKYFSIMRSGDPVILANLRKARNQAMLLAKEIESEYAYKKVVQFMGKSSLRFLSVSYSEGLIQQLGYDVDGFAGWVKSNGVPCVFKGDSSMHLDVMKSALEYSVSDKVIINRRPEFEIFIQDKEGCKREILGQVVVIVEPTPEGIFLYGYSLIKQLGVEKKDKDGLQLNYDQPLKMKKLTSVNNDVNEPVSNSLTN